MTTSAPVAGSMPWTRKRVRVTGGLMLAMLVAAMDSSVVATAIPTIVSELGGFALYPWLIAGYLLTSTTTVPLWGRLADIQGRRRVLLAGLAWFLAASLLCAAAPNMAWLVGFRAVQGVGAGCVLPVALTTVGDIFPLEQRARLQGLFSSTWAVAALSGPTLGAVFVTTIGWRWIFWINLPIVLVTAALLWAYHDAPPREERGRLDYVGAATLTAGVGLLLFGLDAGGGHGPSWPLVALGLAALGLFGLAQRRTAHPTVPFALLRHPIIGPATAAAFLAGTVMFALNAFLPLQVQGVLQRSSFEGGAAISVASLGWTGAAVFSGRLLLRVGYQRLVVTGALSMVAGSVLLLVQPRGAGVAWVAAAAFVIGTGMGQLQTPLLIVMQNVVDWRQRGATTALNQFSRTIGGAVGVSLLGVLLSTRARAAAAAHGVDLAAVANPLSGGHLDAITAPPVGDALRAIYAVLLLISLATLAIALAILWINRGPRAQATELRGTSARGKGRGTAGSARSARAGRGGTP